VIDQMGRALGHAPGAARGADAAPLAGESDEKIVAALPATRTGEAVGENTALQVATQLPFGMGRDALILPILVAQGKEGLEVALHRAVERRLGRAPSAIGGGCASLRLDRHVRIRGRVARL